ncbi:hypothetical protein MTR67_019290 [Solanum verrucosum]|uniref:Reverse transcriptase n=1 Tax=Solanum verrucosum TaxID=315347 RepID=A0AAF0QRK2_SOLVR|nr:hypothetical protein MTR67_019290 [Solanum verrucosum]
MVGKWEWVDNYNTDPRGRLWILWDPNKVKFRVDVVHKQFIHGYVTTQSSGFYLTRVYGMHTIADRKHLWTGLTQVTNAVTEPLVIMGDFNSILHGDDRFGGNVVMDGEVQDFKKFMETASIIGMKCLGRRYTWTNGHIHRKIDWILTNASWVHKWEHIQGLIMEPLFSDHCVVSFPLGDRQNSGQKSFKFFNHIAEHPDFIGVVRKGWRGMTYPTMRGVWQNLKKVKVLIQKLNTKAFKGVTERVNQKRKQLINLQGLMSDPLAASRLAMDEKQCKVELERWINIEESILMQKSRVQWLKLGYANTSYFHACLKSRQSQKQITQLMSLEGIVLSSGSQVEGEITKFYKQLLGSAATSLPAVDITIMGGGNVLLRDQQLQLVRQVEMEEIWKALAGISDTKSLGYDGFNAYFFKKGWSVMGEEITSAVMEFFNTTREIMGCMGPYILCQRKRYMGGGT